MNPFECELDPKYLYNIGTGKAASDATKTFLLNVYNNGEFERTKLIKTIRGFKRLLNKTKSIILQKKWESTISNPWMARLFQFVS